MGLLDKLFNRTSKAQSAGAAAAGRARAVGERPQPPSPPASRSTGTITWTPAGRSITVAGHSIGGGMVYVGARAASPSGRGIEPALIDPSLRVDRRRPDVQGTSMGYWPAYHDISPGARAAYLAWLADGRRDPHAYIGYVFLFFYGLERRVLVDLAERPDAPEIAAIAAEVRRLLGLYGRNGSFHSYATRFLALVDAISARSAPLTPPDWRTVERDWPLPMAVRMAYARYIAARQPVADDWALLLVRTHPDMYLRTPAQRCSDAFDELFRLRYRARFGDGQRIAVPKRRVSVEYHPASAGLGSEIRARFDDMPDVVAATKALDELRTLAGECCDALDGYSRFLGRNPDAADEPAAAGLLPAELLDSHGGATLTALRTWATDVVSAGPAAVGIDDVVQRWSPGREAKLTKSDAVALAGLLAKLGVGIEPDPRFGGKTPAPGTRVVLFSLGDGASAAPSAQYSAASVLVHLTAVVASADGSIDDNERAHLAAHLEAVLGLDAAERARLDAHLAWLALDKVSLAGVKRRVDALDGERRHAIAGFLVDLAAADGQVTPAEITTLTKLYKLLGLDEAEVYSTIHSLGTGDGPVTVRAADTSEARHTIPAPGSAAVVLDDAKVRARLAETATVTAMLADIFTDDDTDPPAIAPAAAQTPEAEPTIPAVDGPLIVGLDAAHSALAHALGAQATWERSTVEDLAAGLGLPLLDGALDRVNEAALDVCGEPLVDGDDPLEINDYAAQELFA